MENEENMASPIFTECCGARVIYYHAKKHVWVCSECGNEVPSPIKVKAEPFPDSWKVRIVTPEKEGTENP
jgi:ribosomal protein L37AE/L43A